MHSALIAIAAALSVSAQSPGEVLSIGWQLTANASQTGGDNSSETLLGSSMAVLGDLNGDHSIDFGIGAPG